METILLVEDEMSVRIIATRILKQLGYDVLPAEDPNVALRIAQEYPEHIHLLLTDMIMPFMNGRELAQKLSETRPTMKVLFMSAYSASIITQRGILEEGVAFLAKPFTRDALAGKIRELLDPLSNKSGHDIPAE